MNLDEGSDWYLASFGDRFDKPAIESNDFVTFVGATDTNWNTTINVGFGELYLGLHFLK